MCLRVCLSAYLSVCSVYLPVCMFLNLREEQEQATGHWRATAAYNHREDRPRNAVLPIEETINPTHNPNNRFNQRPNALHVALQHLTRTRQQMGWVSVCVCVSVSVSVSASVSVSMCVSVCVVVSVSVSISV